MADDPAASLAAQWEAVRAAHGEGPVQMINLIKFRERAAYPPDYCGDPSPDCSGAEAFDRFDDIAGRVMTGGGSRDVLANEVTGVWVGNPARHGWDLISVVEYPSMAALFDVQDDPQMELAMVHSLAGVERWVILATTPKVDPPAVP